MNPRESAVLYETLAALVAWTNRTLASGSLAATADRNGTSLKVGRDASRGYRSALRFTGTSSKQSRSLTEANRYTYVGGNPVSQRSVSLGPCAGAGASLTISHAEGIGW